MSSGFTFGSNAGAPSFGSTNPTGFGAGSTSGGQLSFGSTAQPQSTSFQLGSSFNKPTGSVAPQQTSFGFGAPASTANTSFGFGAQGSVAPSTAGLGSFGTPASAAPAAGFGLGGTTQPSATPNLSFGAPSSSFGFGTPQTSTGNTAFGTPQSSAPTLGFGQTATPNLSFGAPQTSAPSLGFGTPQTTATNLSFGAPQSTAHNLSFGAPQTSTAPNLSFGTPQTKTATGLTFGAPTTSATTGFGVGSAPASGFGGLSTPATSLGGALGGISTGLTIGSTTTASSTPGFSIGGLTTSSAPSLSFGSTGAPATTSTLSTGLTFGATPAATAPNTTFGANTTTQASLGSVNFKTTPATSFNTSLGTTTTTQPEKNGLGGIQTSTSASLNAAIPKEVPPREQPVPNEIQQDIENFRNYIKQQKTYSSDVSRCSVKDFRGVENQIKLLNSVIKEVESQLEKNRNLAEKIKYDTANGLELLEMAQRTQDTPAGLQYENVAPMNFFLKLADTFENKMHELKIQIENTDKYVKDFGQTATLTAQDLSLGMKKLHDTFVALAGRLQSVHNQVETQKEMYQNLRKQVANDYSNPFESLDKKLVHDKEKVTSLASSVPKIACGPTPFNQVTIPNFPITSQQNIGASALGSSQLLGTPGTASLPPAFGASSSFNTTNTSFQPFATATPIQLQKPPTGNKRGKQ